MPVSDSTSVAQKATLSADQRKAAAVLLRANTSPTVAELGELVRRGPGTSSRSSAVRCGTCSSARARGPRPDHRRGAGAGARDHARPGRTRRGRWASSSARSACASGTRSSRSPPTGARRTTASRASPTVKYGTSLVEDLERRDFTINAMAARLPSFELVDPFGGLAALKEQVIRTPGRPEDSFSDDPLRILRAARFAARLGLHRGRGRAGGDGRDGRRGCRSCRRSGSPTSCPSSC